MNKHVLSLDIPSVSNPEVIKINDLSVYSEDLLFECPRLDITLPGYSETIYITSDLNKGFNRILTSEDLSISGMSGNTLSDLPDGLYNIKYSVAPNDKVSVEYYHLRYTKAMNIYNSELCKIHLDFCEPTKDTLQKLEKLRLLKSYLEAAKAQAEVCHNPHRAIDMLNYATRELIYLKSGGCESC